VRDFNLDVLGGKKSHIQMRNEKLPLLKLWSFKFRGAFEIASIWRLRVRVHAPKSVKKIVRLI
jgi:hypothetical protein